MAGPRVAVAWGNPDIELIRGRLGLWEPGYVAAMSRSGAARVRMRLRVFFAYGIV